MDFDRISTVSLQRALRWHPGGLQEWSPIDWSNAMYGEGGEKANVVKKVRRIDDKLVQAEGPKSYDEAYAKLAMEIGDTYLYADLLLQRIGLRMSAVIDEAVAAKRISIPYGYPLVKLSNKAGGCIGRICDLTDELDDLWTYGRATRSRAMIVADIGDVMAKLVALLQEMATTIRRSLETCVIETFNRVSIRENFPERL